MSWTRNDSIELGKLALLAGFVDVDEACEALATGARIYFHGFTAEEMEKAINYLRAADRV